ncbi:hypothetical protein HQ529_05890 [Candidatus Woesearchaeota archaeon]|nr:hypothetical protein [Candidatus Woesearchaeota archaeon]
MKQISNKTLAMLLIAAIVISVGGTVVNVYRIKMQITRPAEIIGLASSGTGTASVTIESLVGITITNDIDFGSGYLNGTVNITLTTETNHSNLGTWNNCSFGTNDTLQGASCKGLNIENTGQRNVNVTMEVDVGANALFEGNNDSDFFKFSILNGTVNETEDGCDGLVYNNATRLGSYFNWTEINSSVTYPICSVLDYTDQNDTITVEINITIPSDESDYATDSEIRTATFTFTAAQLGVA